MKKPIILLLIMNMFSGMGYSILAPLFPSLGKKFGINEDLIGWILSTYAFSNCIITPFIPSLCRYFTRIKILYFSTFCEATCTILYGFLQYISSYKALLIIVFIIRIIHGICSAFIATLIYSITCSLADEKEIEVALGNIEVGLSMGTSSGPIFASIFYHIGGYPLPFFVLGLVLYISVYLTKIIEKENIESDEIEEDPPFFGLLKNVNILYLFCSFIFGMIALTFYDPCLTYHLNKNYSLSIGTSSLFFVVPIIAYFIMIQFLKLLSNSIGYHASMSIGLFLTSIGCFCIYPVPPIPKYIISVIFGLIFLGLGGSPIYVPGLLSLTKEVKGNNIDEKTANDIASAMNNLSVSIGDFIGPILGGFLTSKYNFKYCCLLVSLIMLFYFIFFTIHFSKDIKDSINSKLLSNEKDKETNNDNNQIEYLVKNISNSLNLKFQAIKGRKYSFQNNKEYNMNISLYTSLSA